MDADALVALLRERLLSGSAELEEELRVREWVFETGLPSNRQNVDSARFNRVDVERSRFSSGTRASVLDTNGWSPHEYIYFLQFVSAQAVSGRMGEIESAWSLDETSNLSLRATSSRWVAGTGHSPSFPAMERYLGAVGGGSGPPGVYSLLKNNGNTTRALNLYRVYRPRYHPYTQAEIDRLLGFTGKLRLAPEAMPDKY